MLIDIKNLKLQVKKSEKFVLEEKLSDEILSNIGGHFIDPCSVELTVERNGKFYLATGKITTKLQLQCFRCLREVTHPVNAELVFTLVEAAYQGEFSREEEIIFFHDTTVDIAPVVQETILLGLPIRILCQEECQGLCPGCGIDKNLAQCKCVQDKIDPRWEKLKSLQTGKEV